MDYFKEGTVCEELSVAQLKEPAATVTDLQLAALRALLASFLSFARVRPPYLSQGLELFRRGTSIYIYIYINLNLNLFYSYYFALKYWYFSRL